VTNLDALLLDGIDRGDRVLIVDPTAAAASQLQRRGARLDALQLKIPVPDVPDRHARSREGVASEAVPWPWRDGTFDGVMILDVLEHVVDDQQVLEEAARVLRPRGWLIVRVPYRGPLAWVDPANAYRYISDVTRRGPHPPETYGIGWRRHYSRTELGDMLSRAGFDRQRAVGTGIGLSPAFDLGCMLMFRWLLPWEPAYRLGQRLIDRLAAVERHLRPGPFGYWLTVVAFTPTADDDCSAFGLGRHELA